MENTTWVRVCHQCKNEITYKKYISFYNATRLNSTCKPCYFERRRNKEITKQTSWQRICVCGNNITYKHLQGYYRAEQNKSRCMKCTNTGRVQPEETKLRRRERKCKMFGGLSYNPKACAIFEEINNERGWSGVHAESGGEFQVEGYCVDYYEPNLNIVIEYDEPHHLKKSRQVKDQIRQQRIVAKLGCKFYRINEGQDWRMFI